MSSPSFDAKVRLEVYRHIIDEGRAPGAPAVLTVRHGGGIRAAVSRAGRASAPGMCGIAGIYPYGEGIADRDELLAIPRHICPTTAMHKQVWVVSDGKMKERWNVAARDRWLTV